MEPTPVSPSVVLTIAGSDCSGGAGLQADLKTFSALGVYGLTAVTCVVAEVPGQVSEIHPVPASIVSEQLRLLLSAFPVVAVKTGMLFSAEIVRVVAAALHDLPAERKPFLVVDPVMVATSGDALVEPAAVEAYVRRLFPAADLITPNLDEASALLGSKVDNANDLEAAAAALASRYGAAILLKGGHLSGKDAIDVYQPLDGRAESFSAPFIQGVSTHGTGCTYSAAIAAGLARGLSLRDAIAQAKTFVTQTISTICRWGSLDALNHSRLE